MDIAELLQVLHPSVLIPASILSEDVTLLAGLAAMQMKKLSSLELITYFSLGLFIGNSLIYFLGTFVKLRSQSKWSQRLALKVENFFKKAETEASDSKSLLASKIDILIVASRFLPGARVPTYLACGMAAYPFWKYHALLLVTFWIFYSCTFAVFKTIPAPLNGSYSIWINLLIGLASMILVALAFKLLAMLSLKIKKD